MPFDNYADVCMVKIKQKVSGCLPTLAGAQDFAAMRPYLAAAPSTSSPKLTSGNVWIPAAT